MKATEIRKSFSRRPFRPLEIILDNGTRLVVRHPEAILIAEDCVALIPLGSRSMEYLSPAAVSHIRPAARDRRGPGRKLGGG